MTTGKSRGHGGDADGGSGVVPDGGGPIKAQPPWPPYWSEEPGSDGTLAVVNVTLIDPEGLPKVDFHKQVSLATGSKLAFMAGQVAWDANGDLVGKGDLAAQIEQCYLNVGAAVADVGGSFDNIAKLTIYIVEWAAEKFPLLHEGRARAFAKLGVNSLVPGTLIGVTALFTPDILVEIEAVAVID